MNNDNLIIKLLKLKLKQRYIYSSFKITHWLVMFIIFGGINCTGHKANLTSVSVLGMFMCDDKDFETKKNK